MKDLSFENPGAPALFLQPPDGAPDIAIEVNVTADQIGENLFEVNLHVEARAKAGETVLFITELDYCAIAEVGDIPDEHKQPLILIEVPRDAVSVCTRNHLECNARWRFPASYDFECGLRGNVSPKHGDGGVEHRARQIILAKLGL